MDQIISLKKQLLEALLDYYIDQHNKDIAELENVYNKYNQEMKENCKNFWDTMIVPNSLRNCFSITDKFVVENIQLITNNGIGYYDYYSDNTSAPVCYKIVYHNKTNYSDNTSASYVTLIKL